MRYLAAWLFASPFALFAISNSAPKPIEITDTIPAAQDIAYPTSIQLSVDATDVVHGIFKVLEVIPQVKVGDLILLYPKWLPGKHSPSGPISKLAGLKISANGVKISWKRDPVDVYAFHVDVPPGNPDLVIEFQYLTPTVINQGRIVTTDAMLNLQWEAVVLYPAGYFVRQIPVTASVTLPDKWKILTALEAESSAGATIHYKTKPLDVLVDSPAMAGLYTKHFELSNDVTLGIVADQERNLVISNDALKAHKNIVTQAVKLFGAQHYDHYTFLLALSDRQSGIGLEHHRSSENGIDSHYFNSWKTDLGSHELLSHEFTHSWNGKFRRPEDLWTPDYKVPMQGSLLWVYEGQTQFWGWVLACRSGMLSHQDSIDALALTAAIYENRKGRLWRPLIDTTNDPVIAQRAPQAWTSFQRSEDYYSEGLLLWLDADSLIRSLSLGKHSMDDFAKRFFGIKDRDYGEVTYTRQDIITTLNQVQPYDWAKFLHERLDVITEDAPLDGIKRGGYKLVYTQTPTKLFKSIELKRGGTDLSYSLGFNIGKEGVITSVVWDGLAFNAGLSVGTTLVAVNSRAFDVAELKEIISSKKSPIELLVRTGSIYRTIQINYTEGLRYPHLEKLDPKASSLDDLLNPKP